MWKNVLVETSINPARLAKVMVITLLSIILLPFLALIVYVELPLGDAMYWHFKNGSTVAVEGHSFHVPLQFQVERYKGGYELTKHDGLFGGLSFVTIEPGGKTLDAQHLGQWQSSLLPYGGYAALTEVGV
jgi:hypothetical protein